MTAIEIQEVRCPRCGYVDVGHYCSNCSYPLDQDHASVYQEMYHSFFLKFLQDHPIAKFLRTLWRVLLHPGGMDLRQTYAPGARYMSDLGFAKVIFFFAIGTAILKLFTSPSEDEIARLVLNWAMQTYVLWIFCFSLLAFVWVGRTWKKLMRYEAEDQRQYDSMYIYDYGLLITVVYCMSLIYGSEIDLLTSSMLATDDAAPQSLSQAEQRAERELALVQAHLAEAGRVLLLAFCARFFWFHLALAHRAGLPKIRALLVTLLCAGLLMFYAIAAELLTMPIAMLPFLYLLAPVYYLARDLLIRIGNTLQPG